MTGRERILATLQGLPVDRRPVVLGLSLYGARLSGRTLHDHYHVPSAYVEGQAAVLAEFRPDVALGPFCLTAEGEAFGSVARHFERQPPTLRSPAARTLAEAAALALPDIESHPRLLYLRESVRLLASAHGRATPVAMPALSPLDLPALLLGADAWMEALLFDPDAARRVLQVTIAFFVRWANALLRDGADCLILPAVFGNSAVVTAKVAETIARPALAEAFAGVKGPLVLHHGGSTPFMPILPLCSGLPNLAAIALDERDDLGAARKALGPGLTLFGGVTGPTLGDHAPEQVETRCAALLGERRADPRFVLYTCAADIPLDAAPDCIHAVRRAAEKTGALP